MILQEVSKKIKGLVYEFWPVIILGFFTLALFLTNYVPGTYLSGWDNLQTELNPSLGVKRALFSVWEEYQGFGLVAGMAHAADLVRAILIWFLSFVLPKSIIRYFFQTLMILVGGLGILGLLGKTGFGKEKRNLAVLGALFYILNFAVIQLMFLPFEPFSIFFGLLPWEIWIFLNVLEKKEVSKKDWLKFFVINLLATPQAYIQQQFVVYVLLLTLITIGILLKERTLRILKRAAIAIVCILLINSFWLLPQMYFLKTSSSVVGQAKINQLATEDVFFANKDKGNLKDFLTFTGFLYDRLDKNHEPLFKTWQAHRESAPITIIIYGLTGIFLLGMFKKSRYQISFIFIYGLTAVFLLSDTFPFSLINETIRSPQSLINQIFRSPFTKFAIPYAFVASYFFACGLDLLLSKKRLYSNRFLFAFVGALIIIQALPAFRGNYFSNEMKVSIPQSYFKTIDYFKNIDKNKRIALLPEYTFWGWFYNSWSFDSAQGKGYNGSGFLWYGIEQPIVSRTFDVWSDKSESYFWEAKNAVEAENIDLFERVLEKYNINYLVYDKSLLPVTSSVKALQYDRIDKILSQSKKITFVRKWDFISLYKVTPQKKIVNFIEVANNLPNIGPKAKVTNLDVIYQTYGDYITDRKYSYDIYYPFLDFTTQTRIPDKKWDIKELIASFYIVRDVDFNTSDYKLSISSSNLEFSLFANQIPTTFVMPFSVFNEQNKVGITFPKMQILSFRPNDTKVENCGNKNGIITAKQEEGSIEVKAKGGAIGCFGYEGKHLDQNYGYILKVRNENFSDQRLFFYILDNTKEQPYIEERFHTNLDYFILGSRFKQGIGYTFVFQNNSHANLESSNKLNELSIYLLPYDELKKLSLTKNQAQIKNASFTDNFKAWKINYFLYSVLPKEGNYIVLNQSFDSGWKAYEMSNFKCQISNVKCFFATNFPFLFGKELKEHVLVNNWANGWRARSAMEQSNNETIIVVFWPQYLQFAGFAVLGLSIASLVFLMLKDLYLYHGRRNKQN